MKRKVLKLVLASVLMIPFVSLAGCSSQPDPKELLEEAAKAMEKVESFRMAIAMDLDMTIEAEGSSMSMTTSMEADSDVISDPFEMHTTTKQSVKGFGLSEETESEQYVIYDEDDDTTRQYVDDGDGYGWYETYYMEEEMPFTEMLEADYDDVEMKTVGSEEVEKQQAYKIEMSMPLGDMSELLGSEYGDMFNELDEDTSLTCYFYIYEDSKELAKIEFDMKALLDEMTGGLLGEMGLDEDSASLDVDEFAISMTFYDYGEVDEIELPKEVLDEDSDDIDEGFSRDDDMAYGDESTQTHVWEDFQITVDGMTITVGTTKLQDLLNAGYALDDSYSNKDETAESGDTLYLLLEKGDKEVYVNVYNNTKDTLKREECIVRSVEVYEEANFDLKGIKAGSSEDEVKAILGEASITNTSSYGTSYSYNVDSDDYSADLYIYFEDGKVENVEISIYYY